MPLSGSNVANLLRKSHFNPDHGRTKIARIKPGKFNISVETHPIRAVVSLKFMLESPL